MKAVLFWGQNKEEGEILELKKKNNKPQTQNLCVSNDKTKINELVKDEISL